MTNTVDLANELNIDQAMKFRCIGPPRGGRVLAVAGHPTDPKTYYFGACAGGIWKSDDAGTYWRNISDGYLNSAAVGALAVSESDPNVIYAGMGEATIRLDVSYGDGVYKSTDGGKTWQHKGLADTNHIGEIRIHPQNPDLVYVAALGHAFGPNAERGVYRSQDGGDTWELVLHKSEKAGAVDLAMSAQNPRVLFASIYETYRTFWTLSSGGPDSGLWRSTDGGDTWVDISENPGLPSGDKGKIGVTVSPANPDRVWAIIESKEKGVVYRSDDGGDTWKQVSDNRDLIHRPWYYCHIFADSQDENTLYITNLKMWKSIDGGENWTEVSTPHGDNHDLWINPNNPQNMIEGNDGGACVTFNGGASWSTIYNQLTSQFYHVAVDNRYPYHVYGTQQDNSSISVPSATEKGAIPWEDCYAAGTGESGYIAVDPKDDDITYVGAIGSSPGGGNALQRYDHKTKQVQLITTWPESYFGWGAKDMKYRFAWTYPIVFSPHDPNLLYVTGNHVFKSSDDGNSWDVISPDLSRNDESKLQPSGGITLDTSGAETYATVFAFDESPVEAGVLWAGTDDGLVHISRDHGANWSEITPPDLPEWSLISMIEASSYDAGAAYMAATGYKLDDYAPYLYRTTDYGATWQKIDSFPADQITRCVREDKVQPGLLFVGTETGIQVSLDAGENWQPFKAGLPVVPVYDLVIKDNDLVVGTHGRSFWIMDDITPLRTAAKQIEAAQLFAPKPTTRLLYGFFVGAFAGPGKNYMLSLGATVTYLQEKDEDGEPIMTVIDGGENPPMGVIIYYTLPAEIDGQVSLTIQDSGGNDIRTFVSKDPDATEESKERTVPAKPGMNRFVWDMHYPNAEVVKGDAMTENSRTGPKVAPGMYGVRLQIGEAVVGTQPIEILKDPRVTATQEELDEQFALWHSLTQKLDDTHKGINKLRRVRSQVSTWGDHLKQGDGEHPITAAATALIEKLDVLETELVGTEATSPRDRLRLPTRLNAKLAGLIDVIRSADTKPTQQSYDVFNELSGKIDTQLSILDGLIGDDLAAFNDLVRESGVTPVVV